MSKNGRMPRAAALAVALVVALTGCAGGVADDRDEARGLLDRPSSPSAATPSASPTPIEEAITFVSVVDGDTIETSAGTVRLIGIDSPERGECGHDEASAALGRVLSSGTTLALELPSGQNDTDRYGRLIRYATTAEGIDLGLLQLQAGNAIARFDSADGYPAHPQEAAYHEAQIATRGADGSVVTAACASVAAPVAPPVAPPAADAWWLQYSSCTKLKKNVVGHPTGPFNRDDPAQAAIYEWFANGTGNHGDGEGDGLACE